MAVSDESHLLAKAFSGLGVDEKSLVSVLGKWHPEQRKSFRKDSPRFFVEDDRNFERWDDQCVALLLQEFLRFQNAVLLWTMHPWERDARLMKEALNKGSDAYGVIVEVACTRSSEELLGTRRAYHALFDHSIEEDVAYHIDGPQSKLLAALVSSYRYEGPKVVEETAKVEAKTLCDAIANAHKKDPIEEEEVKRILAMRSKPHLRRMYNYHKDIFDGNIDQDIDAGVSLRVTIQCLCNPHKYFCKVLDKALRHGADEVSKEALTRVVVTRAGVEIKDIDEEYKNIYGISLAEHIDDMANGNYMEVLLLHCYPDERICKLITKLVTHMYEIFCASLLIF